MLTTLAVLALVSLPFALDLYFAVRESKPVEEEYVHDGRQSMRGSHPHHLETASKIGGRFYFDAPTYLNEGVPRSYLISSALSLIVFLGVVRSSA